MKNLWIDALKHTAVSVAIMVLVILAGAAFNKPLHIEGAVMAILFFLGRERAQVEDTLRISAADFTKGWNVFKWPRANRYDLFPAAAVVLLLALLIELTR